MYNSSISLPLHHRVHVHGDKCSSAPWSLTFTSDLKAIRYLGELLKGKTLYTLSCSESRGGFPWPTGWSPAHSKATELPQPAALTSGLAPLTDGPAALGASS